MASPEKQGLNSPNYLHDSKKTEANGSKRRLRVTLIVLAIILIIVALIIVTLIFTVFKPKDPNVSVHPIGLEHFDLFQPNSVNVPLKLVITIANSNYGAFEYINSTGYIYYHDTVVGEIPLATHLVPARSEVNVSATANVMVEKLIQNPHFFEDVGNGAFTITNKVTLPGKVIAFKIIKVKASVDISCDVFFKIESSALVANSNCISKIKI